MTKRALTLVGKAARRRKDADRAYREAIAAARQEGHTLEAIGEAAGVTRQGIDYLLRERGRA